MLQLQAKRKKPPKGHNRCAALISLKIRLNQASFTDFSMHSRSTVLKPPSSYSFITDTLFTLSVSFEKNLNNKLFNSLISSLGVGRTKQAKGNFGIRKSLTVVNFL